MDAYAELTQKMGALYEEMKKISEAMAAAEGAEAEAMKATLEEKKSAYASLKERRNLIGDMNAIVADGAHKVVVAERATAPVVESRKGSPIQDARYADAFADYLKRGSHPGYDTRALSAGSAADGGYLPSEGFYAELQKSIQQEAAILNLVRRIPVGTFNTNLTLEVDFASTDFDSTPTSEGWAGEAGAISEYSPTYDNKVFTGYTLSRIVKVSKELVADAPSRGPGFSVESIVANRLGALFAHSIEYALWHGNGTNKPQGIKNASITNSVTLTTAGTLTADELIDWVYTLPQKYRVSPTCAIVAHDSFFKAVRKLKMAYQTSGTLPYLWEESFKAGEPARLLGIPVYASPYVSAFANTASQIHAVVGDFNHMVMAERSGMDIQVLRELYAGNGQIGYAGAMRLDAKVTRIDAFATLKNGA